eukprot:g7928.t1
MPILQENQVYYFSGGRLKVADRRFSSVNNQYECTFDANADIRNCADSGDIKLVSFDFTPIQRLEGMPAKSTVDVIGIVATATDATSITTKAGKELMKRDLELLDDSGAQVKVTLWGDKATEDQPYDTKPVLAMKGASTSDFGGVSLNTWRSTQVIVNPEVPEAERVRQWYHQGGGASMQATSLSSAGGGGGGKDTFETRRPMSAIREENLGTSADGKPSYITVKGTVTFIKHDQDTGPWYHACPAHTGMKNKVLEETDGQWRCEKNGMTYDTKTNRYILPLTVTDHSGNHWATCFDDEAKAILGGVTADQMEEYKREDESKFESVIQGATFQEFVFRLRIKEEEYNEERRTKVAVMRATPVNYQAESRDLLAAIAKYD